MSKQDRATSDLNVSGTNRKIDTQLTQAGSLAVLATTLRRERQSLPADAQGFASNLIEQIAEYQRGDEHQRELLRPLMARQIEKLEVARVSR